MVDVAEDDREAAAFRAHALDIVGSWSVHDDDDGRLFYYNLESRESRWRVPDELRALESAFMMKLMLDGALARSGAWTVHDSGDGTLYYFNEKTRESVWERPEEWGVENVVAGNGQASVPPPPPAPPGQSKKPEPVAERETAKKKDSKTKKEKKKKEAAVEKDEEAARALPSAEELEVLRQRAAEAQRSRESFCEMLRDKKIMPFCKWSVAFPQIVADPRFLAVATMEERQEIFEDFVAKRPSDLKSEKKQKLKDAKKKFSKVLREQFKQQRERGAFDEKLTLSVFLATLEDNIPAEQHKTLQQDVLAFLPLAVQEKLWQKEMTDFLEATKAGREQETKLRAFLLEKLSGRGSFVTWHDGAVQDSLTAFFAAEGDTKISEAIQQGVVGQVVKTLSVQAQAGEHHHPRPLVPRSESREDGRYRPVDFTERKDGSTHAAISNEERGRDVRGRDRSESRDRGNKYGGRDSLSRGRPRRSSSRSSSRSRSRSRGRRNDRDRDRSYDRRSSRRERRSRRSRSSSRSRSGSSSPSRDRGRHRH